MYIHVPLHRLDFLLDVVTSFWFSDSSESASREIGIFFPGFSIDRWFLEEEEYFRKGAVKLCAQEFVHHIKFCS
jgi:hypothetical protein